jgi:hypothetical protein
MKTSGFDVIGCERYEYSISKHFFWGGGDVSYGLGKALLHGSIPLIGQIPALLSYIAVCMLDPTNSFRPVDHSQGWAGYGDNIRIIVRANHSDA